METSRYTRYSTTRFPKQKRTIRLQGSFEDRNKWIRCWNCGFIVNTERDLGDPEHAGTYQTDVNVDSPNPMGSGTDPIITIEGLNTIGLIENGKDGEPITDYYTPRNPLVNRGCPFCGTNNL